jgi:hypothetical protein
LLADLVTYHDVVVETAVQEPSALEAPERHERRVSAQGHVGAPTVWRLWSEISVPFWVSTSRIVVGLVFAHLILVLLPEAHQHIPIGGVLDHSTWLGAFDRWDSQYYLFIAQHGYPLHPSGLSQHTAFFPGYSLLITAVHGLTFGTLSYLASATVVSWLAFVGAAILLYRLAERRFSTRVALIATVLFCWFPTSFFFMAPYSEALFAFEILLVLTCLERNRFLAAALVAAYASATSPESVALTLALMVAVGVATKSVVRVVAYGAISGFGLGAYMLFLWNQFGTPFEFIDVQKSWARSEHFLFVGLYRNVQALEHYITGSGTARPNPLAPTFTNLKWVWILDDAALVLATVLALALIAMAIRRWRSPLASNLALPSENATIPPSYVIVSVVIVVIAACTTISPYALPQYASSEGEARFVSIAMPLYVSGALLIRRWASLISLAVAGSVILALLFQALYNLGYWVT